jgi:hypothetical protein
VAPTVPSTSFSQDGGTVNYYASVAPDGITWTVTGHGTYEGIDRFVSAQAVVPSPITTTDFAVWNYLYADSLTACMGLGGSTTTSVPVVARGNLCMSASAKYTGSRLEVGGTLTMTGSSKIGAAAAKIPVLRVHGTCQGVTTGTGVCNGSTGSIFATSVGSTLDLTPAMPPINLATAYSTTNPGPATGHDCQAGSGVPTPFFDNDRTLNNSVASVNLFPATSYDCKIGSNEIKWTAPSGPFLVNGEFYFDGTLAFSGSKHITYSGQGSLYFTGGVSVLGSAWLCGIANCTASWNPDLAGVIIVAGCWANSTGSSLITFASTGTYCVDYGGSSASIKMQVGTYVKTDYRLGGSASNWGPVLADTITLEGSTSTLIPFHTMPPGTPLNSVTTYLPADPPTNWGG